MYTEIRHRRARVADMTMVIALILYLAALCIFDVVMAIFSSLLPAIVNLAGLVTLIVFLAIRANKPAVGFASAGSEIAILSTLVVLCIASSIPDIIIGEGVAGILQLSLMAYILITLIFVLVYTLVRGKIRERFAAAQATTIETKKQRRDFHAEVAFAILSFFNFMLALAGIAMCAASISTCEAGRQQQIADGTTVDDYYYRYDSIYDDPSDYSYGYHYRRSPKKGSSGSSGSSSSDSSSSSGSSGGKTYGGSGSGKKIGDSGDEPDAGKVYALLAVFIVQIVFYIVYFFVRLKKPTSFFVSVWFTQALLTCCMISNSVTGVLALWDISNVSYFAGIVALANIGFLIVLLNFQFWYTLAHHRRGGWKRHFAASEVETTYVFCAPAAGPVPPFHTLNSNASSLNKIPTQNSFQQGQGYLDPTTQQYGYPMPTLSPQPLLHNGLPPSPQPMSHYGPPSSQPYGAHQPLVPPGPYSHPQPQCHEPASASYAQPQPQYHNPSYGPPLMSQESPMPPSQTGQWNHQA